MRSNAHQFGIVAAIILLVGIIAYAAWWEYKHPCLRYEDRSTTCGGGMYCAMYDSNGNCFIWQTEPEYPSVCVERGHRE